MEQQQPAAKPGKKAAPKVILAVVLVAAGYFGYTRISHALHYENTDNAQIESNATPVIPRIPGYIDSVELKDFQNVKEGQLLVVLDKKPYEIAAHQAAADLATAEADLTNALSQINNLDASKGVANANVDVQQVRLQKAQNDMNRDKALYEEGTITLKQYEDTKAIYETAVKELGANNQQVNQVSTQYSSANAQIQRAHALVETKKAALEIAMLNLSYTQVIAPVSGRIGKTNLQKGQLLAAGQPLFTIVNNEQYWIVANFKETQLQHMRVGQEAELTIDGYPDRKITGKISSFSDATGAKFSLLPPDNATGNFVKVTQRVPVKIEIDNAESLKDILKAGLSVDVDVKVK